VALETKRPLLEVKDLRTQFFTQDGVVKAVNGVSFTLNEGEALGLVGESGCGKSVSALSLMRLIPQPPGKIVSGEVTFDGRDLLKLKEDDMRKVRGNDIAMIFQDPMTSLNPVLTIGRQIGEALELHKGMDRSAARKRTIELLELVGIPAARTRVDDYPHQFSGGMRQRVMIAMALSCEPKLLLADEPTTALDVTIQAQILDLIKRLREELGMAIIMITHDLGVIAEIADDVVVMYAGAAMETADRDTTFYHPHHPYTEGLLHSLPGYGTRERLVPIAGQPPSLISLPEGCPFRPRCAYSFDKCTDTPPLMELAGEPGHRSACWLPVERKQRDAYRHESAVAQAAAR
jgi:oligopeptide transport system ATP-binding protein